MASAERELLGNESLFYDRFSRDPVFSRLGPETRVLLWILSEEGPGVRSGEGLTLTSIVERLEAAGCELPPRKLAALLDDLVARGGVLRDRNRFRLFAPLLAKWLQSSTLVKLASDRQTVSGESP